MGASCSTNADAPTKQRAAPAFISNLVAVELLAGPTTSSTSSSSAEDETAPTCDSSCCKRLWVRISHTCRAGSNFVLLERIAVHGPPTAELAENRRVGFLVGSSVSKNGNFRLAEEFDVKPLHKNNQTESYRMCSRVQ